MNSPYDMDSSAVEVPLEDPADLIAAAMRSVDRAPLTKAELNLDCAELEMRRVNFSGDVTLSYLRERDEPVKVTATVFDVPTQQVQWQVDEDQPGVMQAHVVNAVRCMTEQHVLFLHLRNPKKAECRGVIRKHGDKGWFATRVSTTVSTQHDLAVVLYPEAKLGQWVHNAFCLLANCGEQ